MTQYQHDAIQELLGAYALDAVDPEEQAIVEHHLGSCPKCRGEVAELREVASLLVHTGGDAPAGVWQRIVDAIDEPPPPLRLTVADRRRPRLSWATKAAAAVTLVAAQSLGVLSLTRNSGSDATTSHLRAAALDALAAPASRVASLQDIAHTTVARFVVTSDGRGYLLGDDLRPLDGQVYELWGRTTSGSVLSLGVVNTPGTYGFAVDPSVHTVMATIEDQPVDETTRPPIIIGELT